MYGSNAKLISYVIRQYLQDQFIQQWYNDENNSVYKIVKKASKWNYLKIPSPKL